MAKGGSKIETFCYVLVWCCCCTPQKYEHSSWRKASQIIRNIRGLESKQGLNINKAKHSTLQTADAPVPPLHLIYCLHIGTLYLQFFLGKYIGILSGKYFFCFSTCHRFWQIWKNGCTSIDLIPDIYPQNKNCTGVCHIFPRSFREFLSIQLRPIIIIIVSETVRILCGRMHMQCMHAYMHIDTKHFFYVFFMFFIRMSYIEVLHTKTQCSYNVNIQNGLVKNETQTCEPGAGRNNFQNISARWVLFIPYLPNEGPLMLSNMFFHPHFSPSPRRCWRSTAGARSQGALPDLRQTSRKMPNRMQ